MKKHLSIIAITTFLVGWLGFSAWMCCQLATVRPNLIKIMGGQNK